MKAGPGNGAVLLTGATGFLGSAIAKRMHASNLEVIALKRSTSSTTRIESLLDSMVSYDVDVQDIATVFQNHPNIAYVIHAATSYGRRGESQSTVVQANVHFPLDVLEHAIPNGVVAFLNCDTFYNSKAFTMPRLSAYVQTKKRFLETARSRVASSGTRFVNMRLFHLYGPDDDPKKFIPMVIRRCVAQESAIDLTPGRQVRDFLYVTDAASAFVDILANVDDLGANEFDVGSGVGHSIRHVCERIRDITSSTTDLRFGALPQPEGEPLIAIAKPEKLLETGWRPRIDLEEGLLRTARTYSDVRSVL